MGQLRVSLFGTLRVQHEGRPLQGFTSAKVQELFSYLLLNRGRPLPREVLAGVLWAHWTTTQSKAYLRKALWQLQQALGVFKEGQSPLQVAPGTVQLTLDERLWLDVAVFEQAYAAVKWKPGNTLDVQRVQQLEKAVQLYAGDLLEHGFQDWCIHERGRLQHLYLLMLDKLMGACEASRQYERGIDYGLKILRHDKAREHTHRQLMRLHYLAGNRTAALRQYLRCAETLEEELDIGPDARTVRLYEKIREGNPEAIAPQPASEAVEEPLPAPSEVLQSLNQLQSGLSSIERQIRKIMSVIDV